MTNIKKREEYHRVPNRKHAGRNEDSGHHPSPLFRPVRFLRDSEIQCPERFMLEGKLTSSASPTEPMPPQERRSRPKREEPLATVAPRSAFRKGRRIRYAGPL